MLTKLKYAGVPTEGLLTVYILYVRSLLTSDMEIVAGTAGTPAEPCAQE